MVKISIVIPFYETYDLTEKLLDVLVPQLTNETELIIIDDSNDKRLDKYSNSCTIIHDKQRNGLSYSRNKGVDISSGKYIAFIDSDDMVSEDYIETLLKAIEEQEKDVILFSWQDMNTKLIVRKPENYAVWKAIYKRDILPRHDDKLQFNEDVDFQAKLKQINHSEGYIDKVLYYYNSNRINSKMWEKKHNFIELLETKGGIDMLKLEVIEPFTLVRFDELKNIQRKSFDNKGTLYVGDVFECDEKLAKYLLGENDKNKVVVKIIEVIPKKLKTEAEPVTETTEEKTKTNKKKASKK